MKSDFKAFFLNLTANDHSNKIVQCCLELIPWGLYAPDSGDIHAKNDDEYYIMNIIVGHLQQMIENKKKKILC